MADQIDHPIIIGVADLKNTKKEIREDGADEPLSLILQVIQSAIQDTQINEEKQKELQQNINSISVVRPWSWPYPDLASTLADKLGIKQEGCYKFVSPHGGNQPAKLVDEACQRISQGKTKVALITGGEALDSLAGYMKAGQLPPTGWTKVDFETFAAEGLRPPSGDSLEGIHGLGAPIQVYALYENAFRAKQNQSFKQNHEESSIMYEEFSKISSKNPNSWHFGKFDSKEVIGTITKNNRPICLPYTKLMCAFNQVNIAGACLITSTSFAKQLGIPKSKWIYIKGGAGIAESEEFYLRSSYNQSPAIIQSIDKALEVSNLTKDQIDLYDFYSCFPIVPKLAANHLQLSTSDPSKPLTLLGGLTSFGGAGNNYSMHAITEMTRQLRKSKDEKKNGLILANGGVLSYQHVVILSNESRKEQYPSSHALPEHCEQLKKEEFDNIAKEGKAIIEAYTVDYSRKGQPKRGHIIGKLESNGHRFIANHADEKTLRILADMENDEIVGKKGKVFQNRDEDERQNLFSFQTDEKL